MLSFELSDFMWAKGRTTPVSGVLHDSEGKAVDLTGLTLSMLIEQNDAAVSVPCSFDNDISVPSRACPAPDITYPNDALIFGDATFDFPAVLLPGAYVYFQKIGELEVHARQVHYVNTNYVTLFIELPEQVDSTWNWWASDDSPTMAQRGKFTFTPNIASMDNGPFELEAKLEYASSIDFSTHLTGRVITPIQP